MELANKESINFEKEIKQMEHNLLKKTESFQSKVKVLMEFKADKLAEEKDLRSKEKLLKNKIKAHEVEKAKISVHKNKLERDLNQNKVDKESTSRQTEASSDIPHHISSPLPPIFSSNL